MHFSAEQTAIVLNQIQESMMSINAALMNGATLPQSSTLQSLQGVVAIARDEILGTLPKERVQIKLASEDMGAHNLAEWQGKALGKRLKHYGPSLDGTEDHSVWGGSVASQKAPEIATFHGLGLPIT
jgi:hypothetical protein